MIVEASKVGAVSVPVGSSQLICIGMTLRVKEWSLEMSNIEGPECDSISGRHVTMIEAKTLRKLSDPFILPFTDALYLQTTALGAKVRVRLKNLIDFC